MTLDHIFADTLKETLSSLTNPATSSHHLPPSLPCSLGALAHHSWFSGQLSPWLHCHDTYALLSLSSLLSTTEWGGGIRLVHNFWQL